MRKKECIVHIGMHKTGTSSIQESLHRQLESETHYYCDLNTPNHSGRIFSLFSEKISHTHKKNGFNKNDINDFNLITRDMLLNNIDSCNIPIMIISGEEISSLLKSDLEDLRDFLYKYFEKVTIVGYVRAVKSFIESLFQQVVKGGKGNFSFPDPHYRDRFEKFDMVFGRSNVKLWKFDPKSFSEGNVVLDFCSRLGITMRAEQTIRVNESLSREALSLLYIYRKYGPGYGIGASVIRENNQMIKALKDIGKTKIKFSPSLIAPVIEKNKEDILWMEERLGEALTESMEPFIDDIGDEEDLLTVDEASFQKLCNLVGYNFLRNDTSSNKEVADLIQTLRMKLAKNITINNTKGNNVMKLIELAQKVQKENTEQLGKMNEKKIAMIIRKTLVQIKKEIEKTDNSKIAIQGFGNFVVKMIEKEEDGNKVMVKRIFFRPVRDPVKEDKESEK